MMTRLTCTTQSNNHLRIQSVLQPLQYLFSTLDTGLLHMYKETIWINVRINVYKYSKLQNLDTTKSTVGKGKVVPVLN